ncbi:MAG: CRISPR-associated endonuclease Cas1 [Candidatus Lokiarchaeota archaeon]|nr:CRISPR-associated endonuclease Cas1 [Candidatus Harpocratesius repetitus]
MIIVVQEPGTRLGKTSEQLKIIRSDGEFKVAFRLIESIVCLTKCYISYDVNIACANYGIPVFYMRKGHPVMATLPYAHHGFVITRKAQFDSYSNGKGMLLMTAIILGAITNKIRMIKYLARNIKRNDVQKAKEFQNKAARMELLRKEVKKIEKEIKNWHLEKNQKIKPQKNTKGTNNEKKRENERKNNIKTENIDKNEEKKEGEIESEEKIENIGNREEMKKEEIESEKKMEFIDSREKDKTNNNENDKKKEYEEENEEKNEEKNEKKIEYPTINKKKKEDDKISEKNLAELKSNEKFFPQFKQPKEIKKTEKIKKSKPNPNGLRAKLMGYEGSASRIYFGLLKEVFPTNLEFSKRVRRPPTDPINASISFGNHLLANEIMVAIVVAGLEPFAGFMHSDRSGRPSLVFDLMEEFRQPIVDRLILRLFRKRILQKKHFTDEGDEFGMRFTKSGMEIFLREFYYLVRKQGEYIKGTFITYQNLMLNQARMMVRYFLGKVKSYKPFLMKW